MSALVEEFVDVDCAEPLEFLWEKKRYKIIYGGRAGVKSWGVAQELIIRAYEGKVRILCGREIQKSIKNSVIKLLSDTIERLGLTDYFDVQRNAIYCPSTGSEFMFEGLHMNVASIKSIESVDIVWIEEAENISENTWDTLIPTIRKAGSEIWITFNPRLATDPTYERFIAPYLVDIDEHGFYEDEDLFVRKTSYKDNPWLTEESRKDMERDKARDYDKYLWIWEGNCLKHTEARIFANWEIEEFDTPDNAQLMFGADWGFSQDPTTLNRLFFDHDKRILYIDYESNQIGCELNNLHILFDKVPGSRKHRIRADNARPETISYMNKTDGFDIVGAKKGPGSIEDGIEFLKSYDIKVHPRCKNTIFELTNYEYKVDKQTEEVLDIIVDKHNHHMDAMRYATEPLWHGGRNVRVMVV